MERERAAREVALGRRAQSILRGDFGPVLRRWVSASILPVTERLRMVVQEPELAPALLGSPVFGLPDDLTSSPALEAALLWFARPGIGEDLTLAVMGTAVTALAGAENRPVPLTRLLGSCGSAARETAMGQFVTQVQGAKAMLRVRRSDRAAWAQHKKLDAVAALLGGQVRSGLSGSDVEIGGKAVVTILTPAGEDRMISLRVPDKNDWKLLEVARRVRGERDPHKTTWMSFAMMVLCAAQAEAGWFDLAATHKPRGATPRRRRSAAHGLVLSDGAYEAILGDIDKWVRMGFSAEPMVVPPENGDYLTVKHREVAGGMGPMGLKTKAQESAAWEVAGRVMARSPWTTVGGTLTALRDSAFVRGLAEKSEPDPVRRETILTAYRRVASEPEIYFPVFLDFRGRVYLRPNLVTYQGRDLQKSLLCFPNQTRWRADDIRSSKIRATAAHAAVLYGGPDKLDKAPLGERIEWWRSERLERAKRQAWQGQWEHTEIAGLLEEADEPMQLLSTLWLQGPGHTDMVACQIDGTCNGLQHLTALFRDETAAPFVNLAGASPDARPSDIYAAVAERVVGRLVGLCDSEPWARRLLAAVKIDRKLCKKPVMVLPYGGTRGTIDDACLAGILEQDPIPRYWTEGDEISGQPYSDWVDGHYAAFRGRDLKDHPLVHSDAKKLGGLVWDCITEVLPKPMTAMQTFRDIARAVGSRTLEWSTGFHTVEHDALWVTQAKAKAEKQGIRFKGLHLPNAVRGLKIRQGRDEIDGPSHTTGIVANFIHSNDAAHLASTADAFYRTGGRSFGAIHDCFISRPTQMATLNSAVRWAFMSHYRADPLSLPVFLYDGKGKKAEAFGSWYELAQACNTAFPEDGSWDPREVLDSQWFFS